MGTERLDPSFSLTLIPISLRHGKMNEIKSDFGNSPACESKTCTN